MTKIDDISGIRNSAKTKIQFTQKSRKKKGTIVEKKGISTTENKEKKARVPQRKIEQTRNNIIFPAGTTDYITAAYKDGECVYYQEQMEADEPFDDVMCRGSAWVGNVTLEVHTVEALLML